MVERVIGLGFVQYLLLLLVAYASSVLLLPYIAHFLAEAGLRRPNYAGREIPLAAGLHLVLLVPTLGTLAVLAGVPAAPAPLIAASTLCLCGFGLAGLVDDVLGTAGHKGFLGHFRALLREGRLTSGAIKALFGGVIALLTALALAAFYPRVFGPWYQVVVNTLLLASAANLLNLFDLRPGRAGKIFYLGLGLCAAMSWRMDLYGGPVFLVAVALFPLFRADLRGRLMLGDTGANLLGATLGLAMALWLTWHAKLAALVLLLALQALSERFSFSRAIERVGILRSLDSWGREAEP